MAIIQVYVLENNINVCLCSNLFKTSTTSIGNWMLDQIRVPKATFYETKKKQQQKTAQMSLNVDELAF